MGFTGNVNDRDEVARWVRHYSGKGIDVVAWDLVGGDMCAYRSKVIETYPAGITKQFVKDGVDLPAILVRECHSCGLEYWPAIRMNAQRYSTRFKQENPECILTATSFERPGLLDYESPKVRDLMLKVCRELVENYDADGLLLDFVRYWILFQEDRMLTNAPLLTEFMRKVRQMLDEVGGKRGQSIPLAAQVLPRVSGCLRYGMDVKTWIQEGIVQYLLPSRSNNTDFNLPVEQFVEAAKGMDCRIFPVIFGDTRFPCPPLYSESETRMTLNMYRAIVNLYYQMGAHGFATMNIGTFPYDKLFQELRDPELVANGPQHYRYSLRDYDNFGNYTNTFTHDTSLNAWILSPPLLTLEPPVEHGKDIQSPVARKQLPFRLADGIKARRGGSLRLRVGNLHPEDDLQIDLNGTLLPKTLENTTGSFEYNRWNYRYESDSLTRSYLYEFSLDNLPVKTGENYLGFQIVTSPSGFGLGGRPAPFVEDVEVIIP